MVTTSGVSALLLVITFLTTAIQHFRIPLLWFFYFIFSVVFAIFVIDDVIENYWTSLVINVGWLALCVFITWRSFPRGKGRKAAKLIGAKARAIRDRLVASMPSGSAIPVPA